MLRLFSPAKINLFLRVISKRLDNYHDLSSIFQTITLGDTLTFERHEQDLLTTTDRHLPIDSSNLVLKAVDLFRRKTSSQHFFKIHLIKRIPIEAGLGGGSSNAATTLWACNQLAKSNVPLKTLQQWGSEIGSDVPFFLSEGTAHCTGRGEHVHPLPPLSRDSSFPLWIVKPLEGLPTSKVYSRLKISEKIKDSFTLDSKWSKIVNLAGNLKEHLFDKTLYFNDLEAPAFAIKPELRTLKTDLLANGFDIALMSGSGSAFFCFGQVKASLHPDLTIFRAAFINRSSDHWYIPDSGGC